MFRSIQSRVVQRVDSIKKKTKSQMDVEKCIRGFLVKEFGSVGHTLGFFASYENKKLHIRLQNKTAANEIVLRSSKLAEACKAQGILIEIISVT